MRPTTAEFWSWSTVVGASAIRAATGEISTSRVSPCPTTCGTTRARTGVRVPAARHPEHGRAGLGVVHRERLESCVVGHQVAVVHGAEALVVEALHHSALAHLAGAEVERRHLPAGRGAVPDADGRV